MVARLWFHVRIYTVWGWVVSVILSKERGQIRARMGTQLEGVMKGKVDTICVVGGVRVQHGQL